MLKVTITKGDGKIEMPPIPAGLSGSITENVNSTESTIIFTCKADDSGALIHRTTDCLNIERGMYRAILDAELQVLADLDIGECFEINVQKAYGNITLVFEHIYEGKGVVH